jgi:hypothetical protein
VRRALHRPTLCLVAALALASQTACRIYTLPPESAARLNDDHWTIAHVGSTPAPSTPPDGAGPPIVRLRERPEIVAAARTPRDKLGIPMGLYELDPLLMAHRRELEVRTRNAHASARTYFIVAGVSAAISATFFATAPLVARHAQSPALAKGLFITWGAIFAVPAIGSVGVALSQQADASALERYYRETYQH